MPDIDYFTEDEMRKRGCSRFLDYLPSRLRSMVTEEMDRKGHSKRGPLSEMEDYNSYTDYGIKTVTCKWNAPLYGHILSIGITAIILSPTLYFYFDASTGEMLNENEKNNRRNKNRTAENHFEKGKSHERNGNYQQAFEEYEKAYQTCSGSYKNENNFKSHRDQMKIEAECEVLIEEGDRESNNESYTHAKAKYQEAFNKTNKQKDVIRSRIAEVEREIEANSYKTGGDAFFAQKDYKNAMNKYIKGRNTSNKNKKAFDKLIDFTQAELKAINDLQVGTIRFDACLFQEAFNSFQSALKLSKDRDTLSIIKIQMEKAQIEIEACNLKREGDLLFEDDKFEAALQKYQSAHDISGVDYEKAEYKKLIENADREFKALSRANLGLQMRTNRDFESAEHEIIAAFLTTHLKEKKSEYQKMLETLKVDKTAASEKKLGDEAFEQEEYEFAQAKYSNAYLMVKNSEDKKMYKNLVQAANEEIDAESFKEFARQAFNANDLGTAKEQIREAIQRSKHSKHQQKFKELQKTIENEIEAISIVKRVEQLLTERDFKKAKQELLKALNKSSLETNIEGYKKIMKKIDVEIKALNAKEEGDIAFQQGEYYGAKDKYSTAFLTSKDEKQRESYKKFIESVNTEINVMEICEMAINLFQAEKYDEAISLFNSGITKSEHESHKIKIQKQIKDAQTEKEVMKIKNKADHLFHDREYEKAVEMYQEAKNKSTRDDKITEIAVMQRNCEREIRSIALKKVGDAFFEQNDYDNALKKYQEAYDNSNIDMEKVEYSALIQKAQTEIEADIESKLGDTDLSNGNVESAKLHYERAITLTKNSNNKMKFNVALSSTKKIGEAIASGKLKFGQDNNSQITSQMQEQSELLKKALKLIEKGESQAANSLIEQALKCFEIGGSCLIDGFTEISVTYLKAIKQIATLLKKIKANDEGSELLETFQDRLKTFCKEIESIQQIFDDEENISVDYESRQEEEGTQENLTEQINLINYIE